MVYTCTISNIEAISVMQGFLRNSKLLLLHLVVIIYQSCEGCNETVGLGDVFGRLHDNGVDVAVQEVGVVQDLDPLLRHTEHPDADVNFLAIR